MPLILAFLAKDWKYLLAIGVLLGAVGYVYRKGEVHIEAADKKVVAARVIHNEEVNSVVQTKVAAAVKEYDELSPIPVPITVPKLVCLAPSGGALLPGTKAASGSNDAGTGVSVSSAPSGQGFDPAPAVSADAEAADVEIDHLQKKVKLLQEFIAALQDAKLVAK
jgi:hypothetical protein